MSWDSEIRRVFLFSDGVGDGCVFERVDGECSGRCGCLVLCGVGCGMGWDRMRLEV
jgi:hypothetical protein